MNSVQLIHRMSEARLKLGKYLVLMLLLKTYLNKYSISLRMIQGIIVMFGILITLLFARALHLIHYPSIQLSEPLQMLQVHEISRYMQ